MNYVITDVKTRRKKYTDMKNDDPQAIAAVNRRMLTVEQYHNLARRIIGKWAPLNLKSAMLRSEDAIDFVAHRIMIGDWGYELGKSDIKTYRGYCGKRAIQDYLNTIRKQQPANFDADALPDNNVIQPCDHLEALEKYEREKDDLIWLMCDLGETQKTCVIMHFIEGMSFSDIGYALNMTREGVRISIKRAMTLMRKKVHE